MIFKLESVVFVSSMVLAALAIYLAFFSFYVASPSIRMLAVFLAVCLFIGGLTMAIIYLLFEMFQKKLGKL